MQKREVHVQKDEYVQKEGFGVRGRRGRGGGRVSRRGGGWRGRGCDRALRRGQVGEACNEDFRVLTGTGSSATR